MVQDVLLNVHTSELELVNGDFVAGDGTAQHERLLIACHRGEWRQHPACGVGIQRYIGDEAPGSLISAIRTELRSDGMTVRTVRLTADGKIEIDAEYE